MLSQWPSNMPWLPPTLTWPSSSLERRAALKPLLWSKMSLSLCLVHVSVAVLLVLSGHLFRPAAAALGDMLEASHDQPNPIASQYYNNATGVLNATLAVLPIPLATARSIIPPQYGILEAAYRALLPDFPEGMYPVLVQAAHDHDIHFQDFGIPDFSRAGYEFPFLDLLQDGYSSFRWAPEQIISATNPVALAGSAEYGTVVHPGSFDPPNDAYAPLAAGGTHFNSSSVVDGSVPVVGSLLPPTRYLDVQFAALAPGEIAAYPLAFFKNVTNQPSFANGSTCDQMIRLFNTSLTAAPFEPVFARGRVSSLLGPFPGVVDVHGVHGVQLATAFIENNYLPCQDFQGYQLTSDV